MTKSVFPTHITLDMIIRSQGLLACEKYHDDVDRYDLKVTTLLHVRFRETGFVKSIGIQTHARAKPTYGHINFLNPHCIGHD